jgi:uncharacterized membrane protein YraQ (UPF0718 family)
MCPTRPPRLAGSLLAVCSCTIVPLFAGIYRKGAGIGPAITFLFFAPAGNIMALAYTGSILGAEFAVARFVLCLLFGIGIGLLMAMLFWRDDAAHDSADRHPVCRQGQHRPGRTGRAAVTGGAADCRHAEAVAADRHHRHSEPAAALGRGLAGHLDPVGAFRCRQRRRRRERQGSLLIVLLLLIGATAWKGLENIIEGANRWTWIALGLAATTLLVAALRLTPHAGLQVALTGRVVAVALTLWAVLRHYARRLNPDDWQAWLWESWRFVKQIFLLLVVGVFIVGMIRQVIRPNGSRLAGSNTVQANAVAVGLACSCTSRRWWKCRWRACSSTWACTLARCSPT